MQNVDKCDKCRILDDIQPSTLIERGVKRYDAWDGVLMPSRDLSQ